MKKRQKTEKGQTRRKSKRAQPHSAAPTSEDKPLQESEERFREAMEATSDGLWDWNVETGEMYFSPAYYRMLGYEPGELSGLKDTWLDLIHPEDRDQALRSNQDCIENRTPNFKIEFRMRTKSGDWKWILGRGRASARDANGQALRMIGTHVDITERKRLEEELGASEVRLRRITENMLDTVVETDLLGICKYASQSHKSLLGYDPEDIVGKSLFDFIHPEDIDNVTETVRRAISSGRLLMGGRFECRYRHADGHYVWLENLANFVRDKNGEMVGSVIGSRDITERKRMEEELRRYSTQLEGLVAERTGKLTESERRFRELADLLPQVVFETNETGNLTFENQAGFAITGYTQEDLDRGLNALQMFPPEEQTKARDRITGALGGERSSGTEYRVQRKDGSTFPAIIHTTAVLREGNTVGLRGIAIDITDHKRAEEEIHAARERLDFAVKSNPAVIYSGKPLPDRSDFVLTYLSERVVSMLGFEPQDFIDHPEFWERHILPEDRRRVLAGMPRLWKEGQLTVEYRFLHKDGTHRWIREEAKLIRDAAGRPIEVIGYWTDVTDRKQMEAELVKSQRFVTIGETAAMVGHDLRNPLQAIVSTLYLAKREMENLPEPSRETAVKPSLVEMLETIENEAYYMNKIVSDLQDYATPLTPEPKPVQMESLIKTALSTIRIPQNIKVSFNAGEALQTVMIDRFILKRIFTNLITNAIQAMPDGGELGIDVYRRDEFLFIAFKDTGMGVPEENMDKLFNPFFTTKAKGQGLGLPVCKRLVEAHNGRITVESKLGEGSTFTVKVPLIKP